MARARTLVPAFFTDERVVSVSFAARLLFQGLWTEADREGRLEDKPLTLKMRLFPADTVDCAALLEELVQAGLIVRYSVEARPLLLVPKFKEHQHVHPKEAPSKLPPPSMHDAKPAMHEVKARENGPCMTVEPGNSVASPSDVQAFGCSGLQAFRPSASSDEAEPPIAAFEIVPPDIELIDSWPKEDFWRAAELTRRSMGYPPQKWPSPLALSKWWGEALSQGDVRQLAEAFSRFAHDKYWSAETPPAPFSAFMKRWNDFLPRRTA